MKLYTRTGDKGLTGLFGGGRVSKADVRVNAYGEVDELNSLLGLVRTQKLWPELDASLARIQNELFDLGSNLATPPAAGDQARAAVPKLHPANIETLEKEIDRASAAAPPLSNFVLPGGSPAAAWLYYARAICRRAERAVVLLSEEEEVAPETVAYLNRLSDLLFAWARESNARAGVTEPIWKSGGSGA